MPTLTALRLVWIPIQTQVGLKCKSSQVNVSICPKWQNSFTRQTKSWIIVFLTEQCWIHTNPADLTAGFQNTNGYNSYVKREDCSSTSVSFCVVTYLEVSNTFSLGGTYIEGVSGAESCKTWCTAREECGAFDLNGANECYWHNNGDWENQLQVGDTSVKQYRKLPCGTGSPTASVTVLVTGTLVLEEYFTVRKRSCGKVMVFFNTCL